MTRKKNQVPFMEMHVNSILTRIIEAAGTYTGRGVNHEGKAFLGTLSLTPLLKGKGVKLQFSAVGENGELFHQEESTLAFGADEKLTLWNLNTNTPGLLPHTLKDSDQTKFIFAYNDVSDVQKFREEIQIEFFDNGDLAYTYSWGMPGSEFKTRSGARMAPIKKMQRHECIKHYTEILEEDDSHYSGSDELLCIGSPFARKMGLKMLGIHHEILPPGRRTSWPHAESTEEEFVYVVEGTPDVWIDGVLYPLMPGDGVAFPVPTGIAHTFINNTGANVRLIVVGEANKNDNKCIYPLHPKRNEEIRKNNFLWEDAPPRTLGPHDGLPNALRASRK